MAAQYHPPGHASRSWERQRLPQDPSHRLWRWRGDTRRREAPSLDCRKNVKVRFKSSDLDKVMPQLNVCAWSAVIVVVIAAPSGGHIEVAMAPMPVSFADPNSDAADPDIGAFGDNYWFVATGQRTGKRWHRQDRNEKESKCNILHGTLPFSGRTPSRCSAECALGIPEVCIELTSIVLNTPLK